MLENSMVAISDTFNSFASLPPVLWSTMVANFGTIPALIISGLIIVGTYTVGKSILKWLKNKFNGMFCKQEVLVVPQTS